MKKKNPIEVSDSVENQTKLIQEQIPIKNVKYEELKAKIKEEKDNYDAVKAKIKENKDNYDAIKVKCEEFHSEGTYNLKNSEYQEVENKMCKLLEESSKYKFEIGTIEIQISELEDKLNKLINKSMKTKNSDKVIKKAEKAGGSKIAFKPEEIIKQDKEVHKEDVKSSNFTKTKKSSKIKPFPKPLSLLDVKQLEDENVFKAGKRPYKFSRAALFDKLKEKRIPLLKYDNFNKADLPEEDKIIELEEISKTNESPENLLSFCNLEEESIPTISNLPEDFNTHTPAEYFKPEFIEILEEVSGPEISSMKNEIIEQNENVLKDKLELKNYESLEELGDPEVILNDRTLFTIEELEEDDGNKGKTTEEIIEQKINKPRDDFDFSNLQKARTAKNIASLPKKLEEIKTPEEPKKLEELKKLEEIKTPEEPKKLEELKKLEEIKTPEEPKKPKEIKTLEETTFISDVSENEPVYNSKSSEPSLKLPFIPKGGDDPKKGHADDKKSDYNSKFRARLLFTMATVIVIGLALTVYWVYKR